MAYPCVKYFVKRIVPWVEALYLGPGTKMF